MKKEPMKSALKVPLSPPGPFFLDSGAHSLYNRELLAKGHRDGYKYFETDAFWEYVDNYAAFVKEHQAGIDHYATVDVIFNPEMSWKVLKYLEDTHKLKPVPVIHYGSDIKWVKKHMDAGYNLIGIGGLGQEITRDSYLVWADKVFDLICTNKKRLPCVRTHGFAMTSYRFLIRYPWWSVDSASWLKAAAYGRLYVPHKRGGKFVFDEEPYLIATSTGSPKVKDKGSHLFTISKMERKILEEWIEFVGIPMGVSDPDTNDEIEWGVISNWSARGVANLRFFEMLLAWLPEWPWPFKHTPRRSFSDIVGGL